MTQTERTDTLIQELQENNRLLRSFNISHQDIYAKAHAGTVKRYIDSLNLQDEWSERYGEVLSPMKAAKIIGRSAQCIHSWASDGRIIKAEEGGILTRSLAAYIQTGVPQGNFIGNPLKPIKKPHVKAVHG